MATTTKYLPSEMAAAIDAIPIFSNISTEDNGMVVVNGKLRDQTSRSIVANGTYDTTDNNEVVVNVSPSNNVTLTDKTVTENGTYLPSGDNVDGYSKLTVNVSSANRLAPKTITESGTYNPSDDGVDGYSMVVVSVEGGGTGFTHGVATSDYNVRTVAWESEAA